MIENYFISLIFLLIVFAVTQGYGELLVNIIFKKNNFDSAEIGFIGFFSLLIISLLVHFFFTI